VLSLFDGVSCGRIALERAGINVDKYYAAEIEKHAISITKYNYPDTIHIGNVNDIDFNEYIGKIDILIGGSPCTFWSISKKNREVDKSGEGWKLFSKYMEALNVIKSKYFLYENVASMPNSIKDFISEEFGFTPIFIDSALLSAQQRKRLYWTNIPGVTQPQNQNIYLQDILEYGYTDRLKSYCIDASYFKGGNLKQYFEKKRRQLVFDKPFRLGHFNSGGQGDRVYAEEGKSICLSVNGGGKGAKTGLYCVAQRGRYNRDGKIEQQLEPRFDGKTNTITTVQKDNMLLNLDDYVIRKLTPVETERLQTLPDDWTACGINKMGNKVNIVDTNRYRCIGNGWTVDVIAHILSFIQT
jgi:DNA (cytosine-5)-methyltransferase 3A